MRKRFMALILALICAATLFAPTSALAGCALRFEGGTKSATIALGESLTVKWEVKGDAIARYEIWLSRGGALVGEKTLRGDATSFTIPAKFFRKAGNYVLTLGAYGRCGNRAIKLAIKVGERASGSGAATGGASGSDCATGSCPATGGASGSDCATGSCPATGGSSGSGTTTGGSTGSGASGSGTTTGGSTGSGASGSGTTTGGSTGSGSTTGSTMRDMAAQVIAETNADRAKNGLTALSQDAELTAAACVRAKEIVELFSHTRPDGTKCYALSPKIRGENIAKGQQSAAKVMAAWMSSSGHRANILRASFQSIGVCAYRVNGIMYWVQLFGN